MKNCLFCDTANKDGCCKYGDMLRGGEQFFEVASIMLSDEGQLPHNAMLLYNIDNVLYKLLTKVCGSVEKSQKANAHMIDGKLTRSSGGTWKRYDGRLFLCFGFLNGRLVSHIEWGRKMVYSVQSGKMNMLDGKWVEKFLGMCHDCEI